MAEKLEVTNETPGAAPETVEVAALVGEKTEPAKAPTKDDLKDLGWSREEIEAAEKRGMIAKPEDKKEEAKPDAEGEGVQPERREEESPAKEEPAKEEVVEEQKPESKKGGSLPDFTMTPEQEKVFLETFGAGTPARAMYFRMKNERRARQAAEKRALENEARLKALEEQASKKTPVPELDENGEIVDPEEKPLTLKALREMQKAEQEQALRAQRQMEERVRAVAQAQKEQEEFAKGEFEDYGDALKLAKEVLLDKEALLTEPWKQQKVDKLIEEFRDLAARADEIGIQERTSAMVAYEIGQLHPSYGAKPKKTGTPKDPKANGGLTPEQMKRIETNTQRRASGATVPAGSGKRSLSPDDIDLKTFNRMSPDERLRFREKYPDQYARLRG